MNNGHSVFITIELKSGEPVYKVRRMRIGGRLRTVTDLVWGEAFSEHGANLFRVDVTKTVYVLGPYMRAETIRRNA